MKAYGLITGELAIIYVIQNACKEQTRTLTRNHHRDTGAFAKHKPFSCGERVLVSGLGDVCLLHHRTPQPFSNLSSSQDNTRRRE